MKKELSKEEIRKELEELDFISPFGKVFVILFNPSYDMCNYSVEMDRSNMEKFIGLDQYLPKIPLSWNDFDVYGKLIEEPEEYKKWRLNHNKQFMETVVTFVVTTKKVNDKIYKIDEASMNNIIEKLAGESVYYITTGLFV